MCMKCRRSNSVVHEMQEPENPSFKSFSRVLVFLFALYGIHISEDKPHCFVRATLYLIMVIFLMWELFNLCFDIHIIYGTVIAGDYDLFYVVIPTLIAIARPIVSVIALLRRQQLLAKLFSDIVSNLLHMFSFKKEKIKTIIIRVELMCGISVVAVFSSFTISRLLLAHVAEKDVIAEKIFNVTNHKIPSTIILTADIVMTHGCELELISAFLFALYCSLLRPMFNRDLYVLDQVNDEIISTIRQQFKTAFQMVQSVNDAFSAFLFLSFATQIFTVCFWARSIALDNSWTDARYHLWVMHFIILSLASFIVLCWAAIIINQKVVSTVQFFTQQIGFIINEPVDVKFGDFLLLMNLQTDPPQITVWNAFIITKGFIITICGTVLTYTVALYGLQ